MSYPVGKQKVRVFTWIILFINVLMLVWLVWDVVQASHRANDCGEFSQDACTAAKDIGTTIGVGLLIGLWVALDVILGVLWLVTRKRQPPIVYIQQGIPTPVPAQQLLSPVPASPQSLVPGFAEPVPAIGPEGRQRSGPVPARSALAAGGLHCGVGPGSAQVLVARDQQMAFTCSGSSGRTVLMVAGRVLVDLIGEHTVYRVVRAAAGQLRFDVETAGSWAIYLRKASRAEAKAF